jgi:signal transduction histidine kinase
MPDIQQPWLVSFLPPSSTHRRAALAVSTFLLVAFVIAVPSAKVMLHQSNIYIPLVATVMFLNDLLTASLLLAQFSIVRSRTLLLLANGYLFTALVVAAYGLVWPGAFHPTGLFGAGPQTRPRLYLIWHAGLPTSVIIYALLKGKEHNTPPVALDSVRTLIFASTTCNILIVCGLTWFVTRFEGILPVLVTSLDRSSEFSHFGTGAILFVCIGAFVLQWRRRLRSVLDLWLSVVTLAWLLGSIMLNAIGARYDVAWYATTGFSVVSATLVLLVLLSESLMLHAQLDLTKRERLRQVEADLAHMNRLSIMGELAASLAHEVTQPIATARNNARAAMNFLDKRPPELGEVREAVGCIVGDADRAGEIIDRIRDHIKKAPPRRDHFDLSEAVKEVIVLAQGAITKNGVSVQTRLAEGLLPVQGDRVQLQQVVLNLILNAVDAMGLVDAGARELLVSIEQNHTNGVLVAVRDSGPGIDPERRERVFEAFYTTKSNGVGMGLSICRSIIDAHGGRLWADANEPLGAVFQFTLPGEGKELMNSLS